MSYLRSGRPALGDVVTCTAPAGSGCPSGCPGGMTCDYTSSDPSKYYTLSGKCFKLAGGEVASSLTTCYAKPRVPGASGPSTGSQIKTGFLAALDWFGGQRAAERAGAVAPPSGGLPSWVMPVGLAAVGVGLILILTKKKKQRPAPAPAAAPAGGAA